MRTVSSDKAAPFRSVPLQIVRLIYLVTVFLGMR